MVLIVEQILLWKFHIFADNGWHHNIQAGSSQIEELSTQNTSKDLDGTKNISLNYNSMKFLNDNTKLKFTGYTRKTDSGYDSWDDANAVTDNLMYAFQMNLEKKTMSKIFLHHMSMFMIDIMILR